MVLTTTASPSSTGPVSCVSTYARSDGPVEVHLDALQPRALLEDPLDLPRLERRHRRTLLPRRGRPALARLRPLEFVCSHCFVAPGGPAAQTSGRYVILRFVGRDANVDRGRRRVGLGGGVVAAVIVMTCVVVAVPVSAFVSHRVHTVLVPSYPRTVDDKSASASCPGSEHVQFGGFASNTGVRGMRRSAGNRWTVDGLTAATGKTPTFTGKVTSIAYCTYGPVPLKITRSKRISGSGAATATCPAGTVVLAGGFATSPHSEVAIQDLERIRADRWRVAVQGSFGRAARS